MTPFNFKPTVDQIQTPGVNRDHELHLPVELSLDQCIKCNICTTACPVSGVTDLFPGPKYAGPQSSRFREPGQLSPDQSVDYCSGCRVCNMVCPTGVKIAEMNARAKAIMVRDGKYSLRLRLRNNLVARAELIGKLTQPIAPLANMVFNFAPARILAEWMFSIHRKAPFPPVSGVKFRDWFEKQNHPKNSSRKVVYFHGCSTQYYEPRVGKAAVHVLETNGFEVIIPQQNCCGLPLLSNGEFNAARRYHTSNVKNLIPFVRAGYNIVGTSTSCILTIKEEAPELLDMYDEDTSLVALHTYDINEFLLIQYEQGNLNLKLKPLPLRLPYHVPCQYKAHRLGRPGTEVLNLIPDLEITESDAACCGIAGTYGYKLEKYGIAMQVGAPLFDFLREFGSPLAVCDSETCRWQITHATGIPAVHPIELLAVSYGFQPEGALEHFLKTMNIPVNL